MSDSRLRELERLAALGDREARVRLLAERVRGGDLPRERLALAAYLGDPAAREEMACLPPGLLGRRYFPRAERRPGTEQNED